MLASEFSDALYGGSNGKANTYPLNRAGSDLLALFVTVPSTVASGLKVQLHWPELPPGPPRGSLAGQVTARSCNAMSE